MKMNMKIIGWSWLANRRHGTPTSTPTRSTDKTAMLIGILFIIILLYLVVNGLSDGKIRGPVCDILSFIVFYNVGYYLLSWGLWDIHFPGWPISATWLTAGVLLGGLCMPAAVLILGTWHSYVRPIRSKWMVVGALFLCCIASVLI